jgi:hypothetical protein
MIQPISKTFYQTTDGTEFTDARDAAAHQARLDETGAVDAYILEVDAADRNATRLRNTLLDYAAWKARQLAA